MLEVGEGLIGPSQLRSSEGKPQELAVIGPDHSALLLVDREFALAGQFGAEQSHKYINGVLDKVARSLRTPETHCVS